MINTYEVTALTKIIAQERIEERLYSREIRTATAMRTSQRRLRREIERILKADGSVQSILDMLDHIPHNKAALQSGGNSGSSCT